MALCILYSASLPSLAVCCVPCPGPLSSLPPLRGLSNFCVVLPHSAGSSPPPGSPPRAARRDACPSTPPGSLSTWQPLGLCSASLSAVCAQRPCSQAQNSPQSCWRVEAGLGGRKAVLHAAAGARPPAALCCHLLSPPGGSLRCPARHHQPVTCTGSIMKGKCDLPPDRVPCAALRLCAGHSPHPKTLIVHTGPALLSVPWPGHPTVGLEPGFPRR